MSRVMLYSLSEMYMYSLMHLGFSSSIQLKKSMCNTLLQITAGDLPYGVQHLLVHLHSRMILGDMFHSWSQSRCYLSEAYRPLRTLWGHWPCSDPQPWTIGRWNRVLSWLTCIDSADRMVWLRAWICKYGAYSSMNSSCLEFGGSEIYWNAEEPKMFK